MTNEELLAKIKAEIEKRKTKAEAERVLYPKTILSAKNFLLINDYVELLSFLSTLESEKPINQEGLEEEMDKFFETMQVLERENIFEDTFKNIARHFAEWQKEQMMKEAVEGRITQDSLMNLIAVSNTIKGYNFDDKVRIIILPKED